MLSAGAYRSPQLLMLSGIGPAEHLQKFGIEPHTDAPNVGLHFRSILLASASGTPTILERSMTPLRPRYLLQSLASRRGKLTSTVAEAAIHWRSDPSLLAPDFQIYFAPVYFSGTAFARPGRPRSRWALVAGT